MDPLSCQTLPNIPTPQALSKACDLHTINCPYFVLFLKVPSSRTRCWGHFLKLQASVETQTRTCASAGDLPPGEREEEHGWSVNLTSLPNSPSHKVLLFKGAGSGKAERGQEFDIKWGPFIFKETSGGGRQVFCSWHWPPQLRSQCPPATPRLLLLLRVSTVFSLLPLLSPKLGLCFLFY